MIPTAYRRRTFTELRNHGLKVRHGSVRMTYLASPTVKDGAWEGPRVAYAFSRRFGNAVDRNRGRRRLRDAFAQAWQKHADGNTWQKHADVDKGQKHADGKHAEPLNGAFLLAASRSILTAPFDSVITDVEHCLSELSLSELSPARAC